MSGRMEEDNAGTQYLLLEGPQKSFNWTSIYLIEENSDTMGSLVSIINWIIAEKYPFFPSDLCGKGTFASPLDAGLGCVTYFGEILENRS